MAMHQNNANTSAFVLASTAALRLLVVEQNDADALQIERAIQHDRPTVQLRRARTLADAETLLSGSCFDVVLLAEEVSDGDCLHLLRHMVRSACLLPVVVLAEYGHDDLAHRVLKMGASDCVQKQLDQGHLNGLAKRLEQAIRRHHMIHQAVAQTRHREHKQSIEVIKSTLASIKHEINNPLAIVYGNAQLLLELTRMEPDEELIKPIRDIAEASSRIAQSLDKLNHIKDIVSRDRVHAEKTNVMLNGQQAERVV